MKLHSGKPGEQTHCLQNRSMSRVFNKKISLLYFLLICVVTLFLVVLGLFWFGFGIFVFVLFCFFKQIPEQIRTTCITPSKTNSFLARVVGSTPKHMKINYQKNKYHTGCHHRLQFDCPVYLSIASMLLWLPVTETTIKAGRQNVIIVSN